jgi:hypothetical protein
VAGGGRLFADYRRLSSTQEFLNELAAVAGIPATELVVTIQGGIPARQGTWVHPDVAVNLAQWCSPKFAVAVSRFVREWMQGKYAAAQRPMTYLESLEALVAQVKEMSGKSWSPKIG